MNVWITLTVFYLLPSIAFGGEKFKVTLELAKREYLPFEYVPYTVTVDRATSGVVKMQGENLLSYHILYFSDPKWSVDLTTAQSIANRKRELINDISRFVYGASEYMRVQGAGFSPPRPSGETVSIPANYQNKTHHIAKLSAAPYEIENPRSRTYFLTPAPGEYRVVCSVSNGFGEGWMSNEVTYVVKQPEGAHAQAWEYLRDNLTCDQPYQGYLRPCDDVYRDSPYLAHKTADENIKITKTVAHNWPNTYYGIQMRYALGMRGLRSERSEHKVIYGEWDEAVEHLRVVAAYGDIAFSPESLLMVAKYELSENEDMDMAIVYLEQLAEKYPQTRAAIEGGIIEKRVRQRRERIKDRPNARPGFLFQF